jgi:hypothetical protein
MCDEEEEEDDDEVGWVIGSVKYELTSTCLQLV